MTASLCIANFSLVSLISYMSNMTEYLCKQVYINNCLIQDSQDQLKGILLSGFDNIHHDAIW